MSELPAGRELDVLVAEKVMGWKQLPSAVPYYNQWEDEQGHRHYLLHPDAPIAVKMMSWRPSVDIRAAWEVVEKLATKNLDFLCSVCGDGTWAEFYDYEWGAGTGQRASIDPRDGGMPLAICRAALKAVGYVANPSENG